MIIKMPITLLYCNSILAYSAIYSIVKIQSFTILILILVISVKVPKLFTVLITKYKLMSSNYFSIAIVCENESQMLERYAVHS